jgi:hypothetical protein
VTALLARALRSAHALAKFVVIVVAVALVLPGASEAAWFRGNTHTHTLNSDGNASPDVVVRWYREHGYQFVVITDHDFLTDTAPLQALFGAEGRFLVIPGEELTQTTMDGDPARSGGRRSGHVTAINVSRLVLPVGEDQGIVGRVAPKGTTLAQTFAENIARIREAGGIAQINHPNFLWSVGVEDMADLPDGTLFELWNGHPLINNLGGTDDRGHTSLSTEALWDALLTRGRRIWGVASDDSHDYYDLQNPDSPGPGRGWIFVRAERLTPGDIVGALQRGDFYASTGVTLEDYVASEREIAIVILAGARFGNRVIPTSSRYLTRFIGKGGRVLAEVPGVRPRYTIRGDEGYVRAVIIDSNGRKAWTQPVFVK